MKRRILLGSIIALTLFLSGIYAGYTFLTLQYPVKHDEKGYYIGPAPLASPPIMEKLYAPPDEWRIVGWFYIVLGILSSLGVLFISAEKETK